MIKATIKSEWIQHRDGIGKQLKVKVIKSDTGQILSEVTADFPMWDLQDLKKETDTSPKDIKKIALEMSVKMAEQYYGDKLDFT